MTMDVPGNKVKLPPDVRHKKAITGPPTFTTPLVSERTVPETLSSVAATHRAFFFTTAVRMWMTVVGASVLLGPAQ